jgi:cephalosporin hydroxylase
VVAEVFQDEWELQQLVSVVEWLEPVRVLEVGAMYGGSLRRWMELPSGQEVVVVDDEMRREDEWHTWAAAQYVLLDTVRGSSQDAAVIERVRELGPYDFCFIDADHTYESVSADWQNFSPLVEDGIVAFHDIIERPGYGVSRLWQEITSVPGTRYIEIHHNAVPPGTGGRAGIGVVWL